VSAKKATKAKASKSIVLSDRDWPEERWRELLADLVGRGFVTWQHATALVLGHLNPPQVGTQVASKAEVQAHYGKGKTWQAVKAWLYAQSGKCSKCGTRLELQAHHVIPQETRHKPRKHHLENFALLCRRCNVIQRASHKKGGLTFLTAESALMWLLFVRQPATYDEFKKLCREYGLTMADIRFQEAWAMAVWLKKEGKYPFTGQSAAYPK